MATTCAKRRRGVSKERNDPSFPEAITHEKSILGSLLVEPQLYEIARRRLQPEHFQLSIHAACYRRIDDLATSGRAVGFVSVFEEMKNHGEVKDDDYAYIASCVDGNVTAGAMLEKHIDIVIDRSLRRDLCRLAETLGGRSRDLTISVDEVLQGATREMADVVLDRDKANNRRRLLNSEVDFSSLVTEVERFFAERLALPAGGSLVLALFTLNTWVFDICDTTPYLLIESAVPECGKTTTLTLLRTLCRTPLETASATEAALFRVLDSTCPTLLLDEQEPLTSNTERAVALRSILNAGYKRGGTALRCDGENHEARTFKVYGPKAIANIGGLRGALLSRCIVLPMHKRPAGVQLKSVREQLLQRESASLRDAIEAYSIEMRDELSAVYECQPDQGYWCGLADRELELWGPLLLHARLAGPATEARALGIALQFSGRKSEIESEDTNFILAREIVEVLQGWEEAKFSPGELVPILAETEGWGALLGEKKTDKAKAAAIGRFVNRYHLQSRLRPHGKTLYDVREAVESILSSLPDTQTPSAASAASAAFVASTSDSFNPRAGVVCAEGTPAMPEYRRDPSRSTSSISFVAADAADAADGSGATSCGTCTVVEVQMLSDPEVASTDDVPRPPLLTGEI